MSQTHLERIADLLPDEQQEYWLRISSRFTNANKDTDDELWLLAELIAMVGLAQRENTENEPLPVTSIDGRTREIAEKHRQTAATLERFAKSLSEKGTGRGARPDKATPALLVALIAMISGLGWMVWRIGSEVGVTF